MLRSSLLALTLIPAALAQTQKGAFATGQYRNLFKEAGHSDTEIATKIDAAFRQLFHGDPDTQTVYYAAGQNANGPLAYLSDINNHDVRSEGMSYGMMIAVQFNKNPSSTPSGTGRRPTCISRARPIPRTSSSRGR